MKKQLSLISLVAGLSVSSISAQTLSQWTFESSLPNLAASAGEWITNLTAEAGIAPGVASGLHTAAATYSNPAGNGTADSFSANGWSSGDFFQFVLATTGYQDIGISFDQTSSSTGPRDFSLRYGTDGVNFTSFADYQVLQNGLAPNGSWSSGTYQSAYTFNFDLSSILAIEDEATVYFRLVNTSALTPSGGAVASTGTDRVDTFTVTATAVPEPAGIFAVAGLLLLASRKLLAGRN